MNKKQRRRYHGLAMYEDRMRAVWIFVGAILVAEIFMIIVDFHK